MEAVEVVTVLAAATVAAEAILPMMSAAAAAAALLLGQRWVKVVIYSLILDMIYITSIDLDLLGQ